ncbi:MULTISPECIES: hypothetical protein [Dietzia]|uniref:Uncharacterized protein n=1 Tax=Dietzia cinnamea TaxID=321318 RepID=A0AAW5Q795_9ACTN|nr:MULTISPECIES: hypothetical protein [Dietzia]MCT1863179.1 hypothetical protein [Dietzia cinnamea]MCT2029656.1 hypothetical protein [Dietzia cinnamea]MCT2032544.1 hypothetical protein [Dietzia cinnamea]MCT2062771.1 hypothetical protein [Dietzia cinnamea]MCT2075451.1 hypothetical protein [Dietzia cinnamea]
MISLVLIFGSSLQLGEGHRLAYMMGGLGIILFLAGAVIPAAAMANTMEPADDPA